MGNELKQGFDNPDDFIVGNDLHMALCDHRGGCSCFISPPCNNCCNPPSEEEAECLGWERPNTERLATSDPEAHRQAIADAEADRHPPLTWADTKPFDAFSRPVIEGHAPVGEWMMFYVAMDYAKEPRNG